MELSLLINKISQLVDNYELIALSHKIHGPYKRPDGRQIVIVVESDGSRRTVSYPKYIMENHLGKKLGPDDTIDHIDFDKDNNDLSNLRVVPRAEHSADDTRRVKNVKLKCSTCKKEFERSPRIIRDKAKKEVGGSHCSRRCAGIYSRKVQLGLIDKIKSPKSVKSVYYRRKNVQAFSEYLFIKYANLF